MSASSLIIFFVNPRTKQPTICGWIVSLLFMSVLINVLLSKVSRHSEEEKDEVVGLHVDVNPKFRNFPTHIPDQQMEKIISPQGDNINGEEDFQPIPIPVFDQHGAMPVFDPNVQHGKKQVVNENRKKGGNKAKLAEHQKPQPKQFPVDVLLRPDVSCDQEQPLLMVIFSRPENRGGRTAIRNTWARFSTDKYLSAEIR